MHRKLSISLLFCWLSLVGVLVLLAHVVPAQASGVVTVCDEAHLRAALAGGGAVSFSCGPNSQITLTSQIVITANTSIDGANGGTPVNLSGPRIFSVTAEASLSLTNLSFLGNFSTSGDGGCLYTSGTLVLNDVELSDCQARKGGRGGALFVASTGKATLVSTRVVSNSADFAGGGVYSLGALTLTNNYVAHNSLTSGFPDGGGGLWTGGSTRIDGSTFYSNTATDGTGGGIRNLGILSVTNSVFNANYAWVVGGGISTGGSTALLSVTFSSNIAVFDGGGLASSGMVTVTNATFNGNVANYAGGGVYNSGTLTLNDSTLNNNSGGNLGGGGGIANGFGTAMLTNVTLSGNSAAGGGGIYNGEIGVTGVPSVTLVLSNSLISGNWAGYGGGGIENSSIMTLTNVIVRDNSAPDGGGIMSANGYLTEGALAVSNSTLSNNAATNGGGGIYNAGTLALSNSTVSGNTANRGGGLFNSGYITYYGHTTLINVTLNNSVPITGTAHNLYVDAGVLTLTNSIVNSNGQYGANCFGAVNPYFQSGGHNVANDTSCGLTNAGDQQGPLVPILLGPLANYGGPTLTHLPRAGSAAIDHGDNAQCAAAPVNNQDQRGVMRPLDGDGDGIAVCDVGAVERRPSDLDILPWVWLPLVRR